MKNNIIIKVSAFVLTVVFLIVFAGFSAFSLVGHNSELFQISKEDALRNALTLETYSHSFLYEHLSAADSHDTIEDSNLKGTAISVTSKDEKGKVDYNRSTLTISENEAATKYDIITTYDSVDVPYIYPNDTIVEQDENGVPTRVYTITAYIDSSEYRSSIISVIGIFYEIKPYLLPVLIISFILGLITFVILIRSTGNNIERPGWYSKFPMELMIATTFLLIAFPLNISYSYMDSYFEFSADSFYYGLLLCAVFLIASIIVAQAWLFCRAIKMNYLWKNSLLNLITRGIIKVFKLFAKGGKSLGTSSKTVFSKSEQYLKEQLNQSREHESSKYNEKLVVMWVSIALGFIAFLNFVILGGILTSWVYGPYLFLALTQIFVNVLILAFGIYMINKTIPIIESIKKLASGEFSHKINLDTMPLGLYHHAKDINEIGNTINIVVDEAMKNERLKTQLITNVSHDIKTPLTSIINYTDLISKVENKGEQLDEYVEVLQRQSEKLKRLIEDLVEASKASSGSVQANVASMDLNLLISQVTCEFEEKLKDSKIDLIVKPAIDTDGTAPHINADGKLMIRVLDNLLTNISKYALENTRAYITTELTDQNINLIFKNVSKEQLDISPDELKERFIRGDKSRHTDGNGLGLSIAESLMHVQGGTLDLEIDGDLFKVTLGFTR